MVDRHRLMRYLGRMLQDIGWGWCVYFGCPAPRPWRGVPQEPATPKGLPPGHPECLCSAPPSSVERGLWDQL